MKFFIISLFSFSFLIQASFAQEVELPLTCNPVIKEYLKTHPQPQTIKQPRYHTLLSLPFKDDFSKPTGIYADSTLWDNTVNGGAFINSTYCDNPPTVGVATFDGIDKNGNPYDSTVTSNVHENCDTLTSLPIDMSGLTAADLVYFTFFYQPQGLGLEPYSDDSLVLEFQDSLGNWNEIWSKPGSADMPFQRFDTIITSGIYFYPGFQFHFYNYAIPNANRSHWNIDYVFLDKNRNLNVDSIYADLNDLGFINQPTSILKDYQSMPWPHYKNYSPQSALMKTSMADSVRSLGYASTTLSYYANIYDQNGNKLFTPGSSIQGSTKDSVTTFSTNLLGFSYPATTSGDSASFLIKNYFNATGPTYPYNDTTYYHQHFYNYYAYDDGSAESTYGLTVANGAIAVQFNLTMQDTLRGLQIYFNPTGYPVHTEFFELCLWDQLDVNANTAHLVYFDYDEMPANIDSINGFVNYYFKQPQLVSGTRYVGIIQQDADPIGVGVDKNTDSNGKIFYSVYNQWATSLIHGSLMIRPILGKNVSVGINEATAESIAYDVFPNPAARTIHLLFNKAGNNSYIIEITNTLGQSVFSEKLGDNIHDAYMDVSNFPDGVYFLQLKDKNKTSSAVRKLIIQH